MHKDGTYTEIQAASTKLIAYGIAKYELCPDGELTDCRQLPKNFEFCVSVRNVQIGKSSRE